MYLLLLLLLLLLRELVPIYVFAHMREHEWACTHHDFSFKKGNEIKNLRGASDFKRPLLQHRFCSRTCCFCCCKEIDKFQEIDSS
jgi:hypothetical protein